MTKTLSHRQLSPRHHLYRLQQRLSSQDGIRLRLHRVLRQPTVDRHRRPDFVQEVSDQVLTVAIEPTWYQLHPITFYGKCIKKDRLITENFFCICKMAQLSGTVVIKFVW